MCLLWAADPREHTYTRESQAYNTSARVDDALRSYNRDIITKSGLSVVILDKAGASTYAIPNHAENLIPFSIPLYCGNISGFLEKSDTGLYRVYLISPSSLLRLWANAGPSAQGVCEMFKLTAALTSTLGIRPYFSQNISAIHQILRLHREENNGAEKMTISTLTPILRSYLFLKGFRASEEILRIQEIGGSLTRGLVLLLLTIRQTPLEGSLAYWRGRPMRRPSTTRPKRKTKVFSEDEHRGMKSLYEEIRSLSSQGTSAPQNRLHDIVLESLGQIDETEVNQIECLMARNGDNNGTERAQLEEYLNLETNDIDLDSPCSQLFPTDENDAEEGQTSEILRIIAPGKRRPAWEQERVTSLLNGRVYKGTWRHNNEIHVRIGPEISAIVLRLFSGSRESFPKDIRVKAEVFPGKRHPHNWALSAVDGDPGAKLAFVVTHRITEYVRDEGKGKARKANTFMDWMSRQPIEIIATRPRRHINAHQAQIMRDLSLPEKGTWYTDDAGNFMRSVEDGWSVTRQK